MLTCLIVNGESPLLIFRELTATGPRRETIAIVKRQSQRARDGYIFRNRETESLDRGRRRRMPRMTKNWKRRKSSMEGYKTAEMYNFIFSQSSLFLLHLLSLLLCFYQVSFPAQVKIVKNCKKKLKFVNIVKNWHCTVQSTHCATQRIDMM